MNRSAIRGAAAAAVFLFAIPGCSTFEHRTGNDVSVTETTWEWVETVTPTQRIDVEEPGRFTLRLRDNGEAQIRYDCNHGGSYYEIEGNELTFGPLTATRIPCRDGSQGVLYMRQLDVVHSYTTEGGELFLKLPEEGTMRFRQSGGI